MSRDTYAAFDRAKRQYWKSCDDDQSDDACGWRQLIVREVYGIGGGRTKGVRDCLGDDQLETKDKLCHARIGFLREHVAWPLGSCMNQFFCWLVHDVNLERLSVYETTAGAVSADAGLPFAALAQALRDRAGSSHCEALRQTSACP